MSGDLIDTTEMYLKTVFELEESGIRPLRARIAERLDHSGPTVSQTVARMERDGLLTLDEHRLIHLTEHGRDLATAVMRKHRLAERHLLDQLGLEYGKVHEEACRWEHVMSEDVERRIAAMIEPPFLDPYGNPIPGLEALGIDPRETEATPGGKDSVKVGSPISDLLAAGDEEPLEIIRIGERAQSNPTVLDELARHDVRPGTIVTGVAESGGYRLEVADGAASGGSIRLTSEAAGQIVVRPAPHR